MIVGCISSESRSSPGSLQTKPLLIRCQQGLFFAGCSEIQGAESGGSEAKQDARACFSSIISFGLDQGSAISTVRMPASMRRKNAAPDASGTCGLRGCRLLSHRESPGRAFDAARTVFFAYHFTRIGSAGRCSDMIESRNLRVFPKPTLCPFFQKLSAPSRTARI